jgi:CxxC motif-containing protein (DUF1111 family)
VLFACGERAANSSPVPPLAASPNDSRSAAGATVDDTTRDAFSLPMPVLSSAERTRFFLGNSFFNQNWVTAPASTAERDGLGPLFNARSCSTCHFKDGRGRAPEPGEDMQTTLLRISLPGAAEHGAPRPDPAYGDQVQPLGVPGAPAEARVVVDYVEHPGSYADGETYVLREPRIQLLEPAYGPFNRELLMSARTAPALVGLGLLEAVSDDQLSTRADPDDRDADGISGRANVVWDASANAMKLGRFGWKAEQPSLRQQIAGAFSGDMGITSSVFPAENCTSAQSECAKLPSGGEPEIDDETLESVVRYVRTLAVPARRELEPEVAMRGDALFRSAGCDACHVETLRTTEVPHVPELSNVDFHPYTDLLLHDLGDALADHRPAFAAGGNEFRTAPLWGVGLVEKVNGRGSFLHDGRARSITDAVLWHGGEAESAKRAFVAMSAADRRALIAFVESL